MKFLLMIFDWSEQTGFSESTVFLSELARQSKSSLQTSLAEINGGNAAASAMDTVYLLK